MKVLMINVVCGICSTGRICTDLASALEKQGHEVKIAYGRENVPKEYKKYAVRIGTDFGVRAHGAKARIFDKAGFGSWYATKKFIEWAKEYDPDIIHMHNIHGYYINVKELFDYLKDANKKVIWTLHDCWSFTGHTAYCDSIKCKRWVKGCYKCPLKKEYPASFLDGSKQNWNNKKQLFTGLDDMTIITPSKWLANWVKHSFLAGYTVKVINNGIDTSLFYPIKGSIKERYNLKQKFVLLGVATSWDEMKGYSDYLQLADILGNDFQIIMVGLTKKQLSLLPKNIIGIERTANVKELVELYSDADLFLNLSYCENFPTVNIEAMACDTPVLTYETGGSPEIVKKHGGYVVKQGEVEKVADVIRRILIEGVVQLSMDKELYDNKTVMEEYLKEYNTTKSDTKINLLVLTNVPSPYRVEFFNELGKKCNLTVLYQKKCSEERDKKWTSNKTENYKSVYLKGISTGVDNSFCPGVVKYLNESYNAIIICGNASPTEILAIEWCKIHKIPYCLEGDGAFINCSNCFKNKCKNLLKKHLISGGDLFLSTCKEHDDYYEFYGAKRSKVERYRFSSLCKDDILKSVISKDEKKAIRIKLNISEKYVVLAVGQFIERKGFDLLIEAATELKNNIGVYFVGGKPTEDYIWKIRKYNITNIHFVGFKTKDKLKEYYLASDVFVLPTREDIWGLVINEAMAYGLPVITTNRCNAGLELIENGQNGFIIPTESSKELRLKIIEVLNNAEEFGKEALNTIQDYAIENMAEDHIRILHKYLRR